ncbi:MAG: O-antigen ligase family protein [Lachnospiraceae bacterium]|nr:O-antigen ligase family protein [Lachnospiraceae bacterium]
MGKPAKKVDLNKENMVKILQWLPVYVTLLILPFVTHYKLHESRFAGEAFFVSETTNFDFDLYYKHSVFLWITGAVILLLCYLLYKKRKEVFTKLNLRKQGFILIPIGVYMVFALLSSVCSEHRIAALTGCDTQFESFFTLLGYVLLAMYLLYLIESERDIKLAGIAFGISMTELSVLGILQYTGHDLYNYEWYQRLITPDGYLEQLGWVGGAGETVVLNAYNSNYAGVFLAMMAALCLGVLLTEKKIWRMAVEIVIFLALVTCQIGTGSKAGFLVLVVTASLAVVYLLRRLYQYWYVLIPALTFVMLAGSLFIQYLNLPIVDRIQEAFAVEKTEENPLERMVTTENGVEVTYKDTYVKIRMSHNEDGFQFTVIDKKGSRMPITWQEENGYFIFENDALSGVTITPLYLNGETPIFALTMAGRDWVFKPGTKWAPEYMYVNEYGQWDTMDETKRVGFYGYERFASYRGFIWSQSIPLLFERIFLGEGANCFAFAYPQNNYKDMYYYVGGITPVTRPHNLYLQMGVEVGVIGLLAMIVFWAVYLLESVKLYFKSTFATWTERIGFGCFLAVFVYLVCGLSNDSMITIAPTFWCIMGVGLAANRLVKIQKKREE